MISIYLSILYSYICVHNDDVMSFLFVIYIRGHVKLPFIQEYDEMYVIRLVFCFGQVLNHRVCH